MTRPLRPRPMKVKDLGSVLLRKKYNMLALIQHNSTVSGSKHVHLVQVS